MPVLTVQQIEHGVATSRARVAGRQIDKKRSGPVERDRRVACGVDGASGGIVADRGEDRRQPRRRSHAAGRRGLHRSRSRRIVDADQTLQAGGAVHGRTGTERGQPAEDRAQAEPAAQRAPWLQRAAPAELALTISRRGGKTGTHAGGCMSRAGPLVPGQAHSPRLSSHSCVRDACAPNDIPGIERNGKRDSQVLHEDTHATWLRNGWVKRVLEAVSQCSKPVRCRRSRARASWLR